MVEARTEARQEQNRQEFECVRHEFSDLRAARRGTGADFLPLTIWSDAAQQIQGRANLHADFWALYIARRGRGTHRIESRDYAVARGDVYAMRPGMAHGYIQSEGLILDAIHFQLGIFDAQTGATLAATPGFSALLGTEEAGGRWLRLTPGALAEVEGIVGELRREWDAGTPDGALLVRAHFLRLLLLLARRHAGAPLGEPAVAPGHESIVAEAVRRLDSGFSEPLRIEKLACDVGLSPDRFTEVFAAVMGRTPRDYLRHVRLEHARRLLETTDDTVAAIAQASGFSDAAHLTRTLRDATGNTPGSLRRKLPKT